VKYNMVDSLERNYKRDPNAWTDVKNGRINHIKRTNSNKATAAQLRGEWSGKLYTYDWAANKIENEESIRLLIEGDDDRLTVQWFANDTLQNISYAELGDQGKEWVALQGQSYDPASKARWYISQSSYDMDTKNGKDILYAGFTIYSLDTREPEQPRIAVMERKK